MCGQQGVAGDVGMHRAIAQDEMRQDGEDRFTPRTLDAPDGETAQTDPDVMRVACEATTLPAAGLMGKLKAEGEDEGEDNLDERLALPKSAM